jgi:membrane protein required for colicin V production
MHAVDILIFIAIGASVLMGIVRGLVREVIALTSLILAVLLAFHATQWVMPSLQGVAVEPVVRVWIARVLLFAATLLLGQLLGWAATFVVNRIPIVNLMNRLMGGLFGLVRGLVLVGLATLLGLHWNLQQTEWWQQSPWMARAEQVAMWVQKLSGPWTVELNSKDKRSS